MYVTIVIITCNVNIKFYIKQYKVIYYMKPIVMIYIFCVFIIRFISFYVPNIIHSDFA